MFALWQWDKRIYFMTIQFVNISLFWFSIHRLIELVALLSIATSMPIFGNRRHQKACLLTNASWKKAHGKRSWSLELYHVYTNILMIWDACNVYCFAAVDSVNLLSKEDDFDFINLLTHNGFDKINKSKSWSDTI